MQPFDLVFIVCALCVAPLWATAALLLVTLGRDGR